MATLFFGDACSPTAPGMNEDDVRPRRRWFAVRRGEPAAAAAFEGAGHWLSMARDDTCCVTDVCDFPVRCREGTLWITSPEDPGDTVVAAGEHLSVTSRGAIMVAALAPSSMWVPEGFAVDDAEGTSRRRMRLRKLRCVATQQCPAARAGDEPRRPTTEMVRLAPLQKFIMIMSRILPPSADAAEAPACPCAVPSSVLSQLLRGAARPAQPTRENAISRDRSIMQTSSTASVHGTRTKPACDAFRRRCEDTLNMDMRRRSPQRWWGDDLQNEP
jgi:hypothetical protein